MMIVPTTRVRLIGRNPMSVSGSSLQCVAELGWAADGSYVIAGTRPRTHSSVSPATLTRRLAATLKGEPMNATFAGDLALVAERAVDGRKLVAVELSTGRIVWHDPSGRQHRGALCTRPRRTVFRRTSRRRSGRSITRFVLLDPAERRDDGATDLSRRARGLRGLGRWAPYPGRRRTQRAARASTTAARASQTYNLSTTCSLSGASRTIPRGGILIAGSLHWQLRARPLRRLHVHCLRCRRRRVALARAAVARDRSGPRAGPHVVGVAVANRALISAAPARGRSSCRARRACRRFRSRGPRR